MVNRDGYTLRGARIALGLTLEEVASRCGCTKSALSRYENAQRPENAAAVANVRSACRAYMAEARRRGYDPAPFHESAIFPDVFPAPRPRQSRELAEVGR